MTLTVSDLRVTYGRHPVLDAVSLACAAGQVLAVMGPNGSGKTTLIKAIDRLVPIRSGSVQVNNVSLATLSRRAIAQRIAYMPQQSEPVPSTVFETVLTGRRMAHGVRRDDLERVEEILTLMRLEDLGLRRTTHLSGGELQKVMLARAIAQKPKVLLLDEPASHLDPFNQIEVLSLLRAVTEAFGIASVLVTHDLNHALRFADAFVLLREGQVLVAGSREAITAETIRATFGIDPLIGEVGGHPVVVPHIGGVRPHFHLNRPGEGGTRLHRHAHSVDDHVYDHEH